MADVTFQRSEYGKALPDWQLVADVCAGERAVKERGDVYLPRPMPKDKSEENRLRYEQYRARAVFYGATGRTLQGLLGAAFNREPVIDLPPALEYAQEDVDGQGVSLYQQSQRTLSQVLQKGRRGLLVDYPHVEGGASRAALAQRAVQATIIAVDAEQIVNWRTEKVGSQHRLSLVVIREKHLSVNGFGLDELDQYRVLSLTEGVYTVELYRETQKGSREWVVVERYIPRRGNGSAWDRIPFAFVGAQDNNADIDTAPLCDLAAVNIAHYRNSADYEDSVYLCGQPNFWISGLDEDWRDWLQKQGLYVGARAPMLLPDGGQFGVAQAQPNTLAKEAMDQKERQMIALGARLVERGSAIMTATQARAETQTEHSVLSLVVQNVSEAYALALGWAADFMNAPGAAVGFQLSTEFMDHQMDAQTLRELVAAWQSGALPNSDLWAELRRAGLIASDKTDEEIQEEIDAAGGAMDLSDAE